MRCFVAGLVTCCSPVFAQTWVQLSDVPGDDRDDAAIFHIGGSIYVGTGMDPGFQPMNDWWRFDTGNEVWSPIATLPASPRLHCSSFALNGKGYLFGGLDANAFLNELWSYDPATDTWTAEPPLPSFGRMSCTAFTIGGTAYIVTGRYGTGDQLTNELWTFEPITEQWSPLAPFPGTARLLCSAFSINGYGYVSTGQDTSVHGVNATWRYDPTTDDWTEVAAFPGTPRFAAVGVTADHFGVVGTGAEYYAPPYLDHLQVYDALSDAWSPLLSFPGGPRKGAVAAYVPGSGLHMGTGSDGALRHDDWYRYEGPLGIAEATAADQPFLGFGDDMFSVHVPADLLGASLQLTDLNGAVMGTWRAENTTTRISSAHLPAGAYFLFIQHPLRTCSLRALVTH